MSGVDIEREGANKNRANNSSYVAATASSSYLIEDMDSSQWTSWLVPMFVVANVAVFLVVMYINNCPKHKHLNFEGNCVASFLGRFSFEPLRENPLFGPSSRT